MNDIKYITINKNRGWRGLAEVAILNSEHYLTAKHIFSFSQNMWNDLIALNKIVVAEEEYVIEFEDTGKLPRPDQQRSVLIKNYTATVKSVNKYSKDEWKSAETGDWIPIVHFIKNTNNHTTSDWNCIGIRVTPFI